MRKCRNRRIRPSGHILSMMSNFSPVRRDEDATSVASIMRSTAATKELRILHESSDYLVVDKPADVVMNRSRTSSGPSLTDDFTVEDLLKAARPHLHDPSLCFGFRFVHRLDFSTSGVLCVALTKRAAAEAMRAFSAGKVFKYYVALVSGHVEPELSAIRRVDIAVGLDSRPDHAHRMCLQGDPHCATGIVKRAVTQVLILQRGFYKDTDVGQRPVTKLLLRPLTGRRHQLRLHCRHIGHTILGDYTYTDRTDTEPHRMFLHSLRLVLPTRTETLDVSTDDPFADVGQAYWKPTETFHSLDDTRIFQQFDDDHQHIRCQAVAAVSSNE